MIVADRFAFKNVKFNISGISYSILIASTTQLDRFYTKLANFHTSKEVTVRKKGAEFIKIAKLIFSEKD